MKKLISLIIIILCLINSVPAFAKDGFIALEPYPYSNHVLGDALIIYGETDFPNVALGLFYPEDQGYNGQSKYIITISRDELRNGYVIQTDEYSRLWPEGDWKVVVQYGNVKSELKIPMSKEAAFNRIVRVCEYSCDALTSLSSYQCRGVILKNNVLSFTTEDNTQIKIFSWNNFSPTENGEATVYISYFNDGYLTDIKTYKGNLSSSGTHFTLNISETKKVKLFFWNDNLIPQ